MRSKFLAVLLLSVVATTVKADQPVSFDVVVYGGTSAGVVAAVQARRMGHTAVIVCPDRHLGGLTAGGLGWTDSGRKEAIGGIAEEFYHRVWKHYQQPDAWTCQPREEFGNRNQSPPREGGDGTTMWVFEPHVAEGIFEELVREHEIPVYRDEWLNRDNGVTLDDDRIVEIRMLSERTLRGRMFIDATYEGDLMAACGVDFHVGREANSVYNESWNGIQVGTLHHGHWFKKPVDPYVVPGDPDSGLLPRISADPPGIRGDGDHRIQAYCFRMCLTNCDENRIPFARPEGYDPAEYELLARVFETGWRETFNKFDPIPNFKTDTNNHGPFSTDNIGFNYDYPEASYERRREIIAEHERYQKGLMYFLANDRRVPDDVRQAMARWGLCRDEFQDNGGWPHQIYVRESRRMIGQYVMTEHDCLDRKETPDSVGMGSYTLDSHNVQRYVTPDGHVQNEGDIGVHVPRPYEVAYGSLIPRREQCENLLVPVCVSSSHIAYGSIRMEPVFMILGQSAATAACLSMDAGLAVQELPYAVLRNQLLRDRQVLELDDPTVLRSRTLPGLVIDDTRAKLSGTWSGSTANRPFVDQGYVHDGNEQQGTKSAEFHCDVPDGMYEVRLLYPPNSNRASNVPVTIESSGKSYRATCDQRKTGDRSSPGSPLGRFKLSGKTVVTITNTGTDGYVVVDAVQLLPVTSADDDATRDR